MDLMKKTENRITFIGIAKKYIKREGIENLLKYIENTDFFEAPASSRYRTFPFALSKIREAYPKSNDSFPRRAIQRDSQILAAKDILRASFLIFPPVKE